MTWELIGGLLMINFDEQQWWENLCVVKVIFCCVSFQAQYLWNLISVFDWFRPFPNQLWGVYKTTTATATASQCCFRFRILAFEDSLFLCEFASLERTMTLSLSIAQLGNPIADVLYCRLRHLKKNSLLLKVYLQRKTMVLGHLSEDGGFILARD